MMIGERLRELREAKNFSQGDIEQRTGLLRCYTSRVENGHTVPAIETLEKYARALEIPMYRFFYDGVKPPKPLPVLRNHKGAAGNNENAREVRAFAKLLSRLDENQTKLLFATASHMARRTRRRRAS